VVQFRERPRGVYASQFENAEEEEEGENGGGGEPVIDEEKLRTLLDLPPAQKVMVVPQGGATIGAEEGVRQLAEEIGLFWAGVARQAAGKDTHIFRDTTQGPLRNESGSSEELSLAVVLPAGTGTTAYFLAKHLLLLHHQAGEQGPTRAEGEAESAAGGESPSRREGGLRAAPRIRVFAVPCCGDGRYLRQQMGRLEGREEVDGTWPITILEGASRPVFARPEAGLYATWQALRREGLLVDLIYAPYAWQVMLEHSPELWGSHSHVMYVHTGGLEGLESQRARYRRMGLENGNGDENGDGNGNGKSREAQQ
jgi:hypothetical protein